MTYKLPEGWKEVRLGEVAMLNSSNYRKSDGWRFANYLDTGNITNNIIDNISFIDLEVDSLPSRARRKILKNDVIYSTVRPIQKHLGIIKEPLENMLVSTGFTVITTDESKAKPYYIYSYLSQDSLTNFLQSIAEQRVSTYPALNISDLETLSINLPPLKEQKAIADTLSAIDDKIEINNKINENLEAQAQAIYKHWFVDFEFPDENGNPYKTSGGEIVESELGMIPKGWEVEALKDACDEIVRGFNSKYVEKSNIKNLNQRVNRGENLEKQYFKYLSEDIEIPDNRYVKKYDILLNSLGKGTLGRTHFYIEDEKNIVADQHITIIRPNNEFAESSYIYQTLISDVYKNLFESLVSGSTGMTMLNISKVREIKVILPSIYLQNVYDELVKTLYRQKEMLISQNEKLANLRDTLLPKLMSGEIRIPLD